MQGEKDIIEYEINKSEDKERKKNQENKGTQKEEEVMREKEGEKKCREGKTRIQNTKKRT